MGCFERTACILSIVKQITSPGWMHEISARAWCTGKTQRNRVEREVGEVIGMGNTCNSKLIHVSVWQNPLKCCEVISLQLIKINEKIKKEKKLKEINQAIQKYNKGRSHLKVYYPETTIGNVIEYHSISFFMQIYKWLNNWIDSWSSFIKMGLLCIHFKFKIVDWHTTMFKKNN